jgi:hypothetical protein
MEIFILRQLNKEQDTSRSLIYENAQYEVIDILESKYEQITRACINEYMNTNNMLCESDSYSLSFNTLLEVVAYSVLNRKYYLFITKYSQNYGECKALYRIKCINELITN